MEILVLRLWEENTHKGISFVHFQQKPGTFATDLDKLCGVSRVPCPASHKVNRSMAVRDMSTNGREHGGSNPIYRVPPSWRDSRFRCCRRAAFLNRAALADAIETETER